LKPFRCGRRRESEKTVSQKNETLDRMIVAPVVLEWAVRLPSEYWPETFDRDGKTWRKEHLTCAGNGEVQCGEYMAGDGECLIVCNE
jgi:hypothetical protein